MSALGTEVPATHGENHWTHRRPDLLPRGEQHHDAKLTDRDVRHIRAVYDEGIVTMTYLADVFGVNRETISRIVHRKTWRHL
jgi:hypothetical protein